MVFADDDDRLATLKSLGQQVRVGGNLKWVILREEYLSQEIGDDQAVESSQPYLYGRKSDLGETPRETTVEEVDGDRRKFVTAYPPQPDGAGMVRIYLQDQ